MKIKKGKLKTLGVSRKYFFLIILVAIAVVYFQSIHFGYTHLDDQNLLLENITNISAIGESFRNTLFSSGNFADIYYRPAFNFLLVLIASIGGTDSLVLFHIVQILIHYLACIFLFLAMKQFNLPDKLSLFSALLLAVHPMFSMAVAWIPGMNDSMTGLLLLSGIFFTIRYFQEEKMTDLVLSLILFSVLVFTKELVISLIPAVILWYFLFKKDARRKSKAIVTILVPMVSIIVLYYFVRSGVVAQSDATAPENIISSIISNLPLLVLLPGKLIYPFDITVLPMIKDTSLIPGIIFWSITIYFIYKNQMRNNKIFIFGLCWYLLFLLPGLAVNPDGFNQDHRLYAAFPGLVLIMSQMKYISGKSIGSLKVEYVLSAIVVIFCIYTLKYIHVFSGRLSFWTEAVTSSPDSHLANSGMGNYYVSVGDLTTAEQYFLQAYNISSNEKFINNNLGYIYIERGDFAKAESFINREIEINPSNSKAYLNLALINLKRENYPEAEKLLLKTLEMNPFDSQAMRYMSAMYFRLGDKERSREYALKLIKLGEQLPEDMKRDLGIQ